MGSYSTLYDPNQWINLWVNATPYNSFNYTTGENNYVIYTGSTGYYNIESAMQNFINGWNTSPIKKVLNKNIRVL